MHAQYAEVRTAKITLVLKIKGLRMLATNLNRTAFARLEYTHTGFTGVRRAFVQHCCEKLGAHRRRKATARKWKNRDDVQDLSHRPHKLSTTLTPGQEAVVVELRRTLLLPLDDLLVVTREFINAAVSRSGLDRCLRRHGVSQLRDLQVFAEGEQPKLKSFKDYEPGFVHVDIKYLPQMPDETALVNTDVRGRSFAGSVAIAR